MFLSLKGALGRNPMINRVGQRLLQAFEGASAAYSLRDLASNIASVVRVRRASDNSEADFSAADVSSGAMTQWVNAQIVPPLDLQELDADGHRTGATITAAAAYSLRNLSASYTGNVVEVRRSSDDAEESFTAAEVADGTLTGWVTDVVTYESDFSVGKDGWHATHASTVIAADPVGTDNVLKVTVDTSSLPKWSAIDRLTVGHSYSIQLEVYVPSSNANVDGIVLMDGSGSMDTSYLGIQTDSWVTISTTGIATISTLSVRPADGTRSSAYSGFQGNGTDHFYVRNVQITDTSDNGFVKKWYDQSGNDNHATQGTNASQPKIVDGGSLVSGGIEFDGVNDRLTCSSLYSSDISVFNVVTTSNTVNTNNYMRMIHLCDGSDSFQITRGGTTDIGELISKNTAFQSGTTSFLHGDINGENLISAITSSTDTDAFVDGSLQSSSSASIVGSGNNATTTIGARDDLVSSTFFAGSHAELIIYTTDQSDNRTAIEANIGETYDIDLPSGVDTGYDQVDGFVETWYDQSGNGNDAVQQVSGSQPKIVDGGVLVTRNGDAAIKSTSNNLMAFTLDSLSADGQQSVFGVLENDITSQDGYGSVFKVLSGSTATGGLNRRPYWFVAPTGYLGLTVGSVGGYNNTIRERRLYSHVMNDIAGGTSTVHQDGTQVDTRSITLDANNNFSQGRLLGVTSNATGALYMSEVIYYPSDQSANREAIEANINNQYDIY